MLSVYPQAHGSGNMECFVHLISCKEGHVKGIANTKSLKFQDLTNF